MKLKKNENEGAHRFSLVTSGRGLNGNEKELDKLVEIYQYIGKHINKLRTLCFSWNMYKRSFTEIS